MLKQTQGEKRFFYLIRSARKSQRSNEVQKPMSPLVIEVLVTQCRFESDEYMSHRSEEIQIRRDVESRLAAVRPILEARARASRNKRMNVHSAKGLVDHLVSLRCNVAKHAGFQSGINVNDRTPKQFRFLQRGQSLDVSSACDKCQEGDNLGDNSACASTAVETATIGRLCHERRLAFTERCSVFGVLFGFVFCSVNACSVISVRRSAFGDVHVRCFLFDSVCCILFCSAFCSQR